MEKNKVNNLLPEQSFSLEFRETVSHYSCMYIYISGLLICMSFTYPKVLTIQGLVHLCIHFGNGTTSHHSINWHGVSVNLNIKEQEKEDEEAGGKRRKPWCFPTTGQALKKLTREEKKGEGGGRGLAHLPLKSQHHCKPIFKGLQKIEER